MGAYEGVIGFLLNLLPVAVPPCHTAFVRAEALFLFSRQYGDRLTAVFAGFATMKFRVAADVGSNCVHREPQCPGNLRNGLPLQPHCVDGFLFLLFHLDNSSFEFAVLCVKPRAVVPMHKRQRYDPPLAYSLGNLCEFMHIFRWRCPVR